MAVKFKLSKKLKNLLSGKIIKEITKKENLDHLGKEAIDVLYKRTKSGKGLTSKETRPGLTKLKPLSESYIEFRKKNPPTGPFAGVKTSNLTYTGEMLESLKHKTIKDGIKITIEGQHSTAKINNIKLVEYVGKDRPFLGLAEIEIKILIRRLKDLVRGIVSRF
jgi:hypothetical protein